MALTFGWKATDVRDSYWKGDPAFRAIPKQALDAYNEDGDGSHIAPYALNGQPTKLTFRNLSADENAMISGLFIDAANNAEAYLRALILCFRIGVDFPDQPERIQTPDGAWHSRIVKERGIRMLAKEYVQGLLADPANRGIVEFYGELIWNASMVTESEKKASLRLFTRTPSLEEGSTAGSTGGSRTVADA